MVIQGFNPSDRDVFGCVQVITHKILEDHPYRMTQLGKVIVTQVLPVEQDPSFARIIQPGQQFNEGRFACTVFSHQCQFFPRTELKGNITQNPVFTVRVMKTDVFENKTFPDRFGKSDRVRFGNNFGLEVKEIKKILEVKCTFRDRGKTVKDALHHRPHTQEGTGKKSQIAETEMPLDGLVDDDGIRSVVTDAAQQGKSSAPGGAAEGEGTVGTVIVPGQVAVTLFEKFGESENLNLFRGFITGSGVTQVVQFTPFLGPSVHQRITLPGEMSLAEKCWNQRHPE